MNGKDFTVFMQNQSVFLEIMNHFIHPDSPAAAVEALTERQIGELLNAGRMHSLFPAVFDAVRTAPAFGALPEPVRQALRQEIRTAVISQVMRTELFHSTYRHLTEGGVTPLVVKGIVLRSLYSHPDYRASSDEDLLVKKEEFFRLDELLRQEGFQAELGENPLSEHEITYWHAKTGSHLEIHLSLFPEDSEAYGHLNEPFRDAFERQITVQIDGTPVHTLHPTDHMLYLICHGLKHFLHSGFGIRQVCDMVVFAEHYGDRIDWLMIEGWARKQGYWIFLVNLFAIGEIYLGFCPEKAGFRMPGNVRIDCGNMLEDLLQSGIYGKSSEDRIHSSNMTLRAAAAGEEKGGIFASMFPDIGYMKGKYPYLEHRKYLLPLAWCQRGAAYLRHSGSGEIRQTLDLGRRRVELLKQYGLTGKKSRRRSGR